MDRYLAPQKDVEFGDLNTLFCRCVGSLRVALAEYWWSLFLLAAVHCIFIVAVVVHLRTPPYKDEDRAAAIAEALRCTDGLQDEAATSFGSTSGLSEAAEVYLKRQSVRVVEMASMASPA